MLAYVGTPDHVALADLEKREYVEDEIYFDETPGLSFGYFQTSLDGEKEFRSDTKCHKDMCKDIAVEFVGKSIGNEYVREELPSIELEIYKLTAYYGRIYTNEKVVATWYKVSVERLTDILNNIGGVSKFVNFMYCYEDQEWEDVCTVGEYLRSGYANDDERDKTAYKTKVQDCGSISERVLDIIRNYNKSSSSKVTQLSASLPHGMTIAQYHSLFPEGKKSKKVIKENIIIMNTKKYNKEFSNYISIMKEALDRENFSAYEAARDMLDESIEDCKHRKELESQLNTSNFGVLNHIFEERLPELFKTNKKAVRDVIKLIKEDKNLSAQFDFYENIRNYKGKISEMVDPVQFLSQFNAVVEKHNLIDKDTIIESNKKLRKVLKENNVVPTEFISEEAMNLYNAGHNLLTKKQTLKNVAIISESIDSVKNYMNKHKGDKVNESVDPHQLIADFENKLKETLTESEMAFVQEITDWRSPIAEQRKEKLFNKFKNECIDKINEMLSEDAGNVELESLKKQIEEQKFNKESIVNDIAKLLEIRDILLDK
jgi:hypothetical protein